MMKGFVSVSKMLGLAALAIGLVVAGCAPGSDTADQAKNMVDHGAFTIPVNVDPANLSLTFGDGANSGIGTFNGFPVEVIDTGCSGTGLPGDQVACTVRVINRSTTHYMTNATLYLSYCADCVASQNWANADCTGSPCLRPCGVDAAGDAGCATAWPAGQNNGYVIVEDGDFADTAPYTVAGGYNHQVPGPLWKPNQVLGPNDFQDVVWNFATNDGTHFTLYANVGVTWQPMDPTADTRNNANDWYNRAVMMFTIVDLDEPYTDVGSIYGPNWSVGSYRHSTVLAGYGAGTNNVALNQGQYFAVNVAVDYPDRIEDQSPGWYAGFSDYEYGTLYAGIIHFNPAVASPVAADGPINGAGITWVLYGGQPTCAQCAHMTTVTMRRMFDSVTGLETMGSTNSQTAFMDKGYVYFFPMILTDPFSWNAAAATGQPWRYYTAGGSIVCTRTANLLPIHAGHFGNTHVNPASAVPVCLTTSLVTTEAAALENEGPDAAPDMPLGLFYFKVEAVGGADSPVGLGTMFYPDAHGSNYTYKYGFTAHTVLGGNASGSDDWMNYCSPFDAGADNATNQGCPAGKITAIPDTDWVFKGQEQSNPKISQTGFVVPGKGSYIGWPVAITVQ